MAVPLLATEAKLLPLLGPAVPLSIPMPTKLGVATKNFPWPFLGYRKVAGQTACRADLDDHARAETAEPLAEFLAALHAVPAHDARRAGGANDTLRRLDIPKRREMAAEWLGKALHAGLIDDPTPY